MQIPVSDGCLARMYEGRTDLDIAQVYGTCDECSGYDADGESCACECHGNTAVYHFDWRVRDCGRVINPATGRMARCKLVEIVRTRQFGCMSTFNTIVCQYVVRASMRQARKLGYALLQDVEQAYQ